MVIFFSLWAHFDVNIQTKNKRIKKTSMILHFHVEKIHSFGLMGKKLTLLDYYKSKRPGHEFHNKCPY